MSEWFSTGRTAAYGRRERLVRAWEPGDGVRCSSAPYNGKVACGEPVAVVKDVLPGGAERNQPEVINRVMCLRHLAKCFDPEVGTSADAEVERAALEELAQRYWDQYQKIRDRLTDELLSARFSALPNDLRSKVIAQVRGGDAA